MRFILDESTVLRLSPFIESLGHDVTTVVRELGKGTSDDVILAFANRERRIAIASDRHFGEMAAVHGRPHAGIMFLRLRKARLPEMQDRILDVLTTHGSDLHRLVIVTRDDVRVR